MVMMMMPMAAKGLIQTQTFVTIGANYALSPLGANGSPLSPLNRHCHPFLLMTILAVTSPFNGVIVAILMAPMVTNGTNDDSNWRQW